MIKSGCSFAYSEDGKMCMPKGGKIKQKGLPVIRPPAKMNGTRGFVRSPKLSVRYAKIRIFSR